MFEAKCYDMHGNSINGFTQWDIDQEIVMKIESCDDNHIEDGYMKIDPEVHFSNVKRDKALVVRASVIEDDIIKVKVPNILLTEPYPLLIYVYYTSSKNSAAQSTIIYTELPIRKRNEPHDYYYVENIERITADMIKDEVRVGVNQTLNERTDAMWTEINAFETTVNTSLSNTEKYVNDELGKVHDRMDEIEDDFSDTKEKVYEALEEVNTATSNVEYMKDFIAQAEKDKEVYHVEDQTLYVENINVNQNMIVGNFIWTNGASGNMSLKWVGGDI